MRLIVEPNVKLRNLVWEWKKLGFLEGEWKKRELNPRVNSVEIRKGKKIGIGADTTAVSFLKKIKQNYKGGFEPPACLNQIR